jgi:nucleotide-binding universal stress UspA family protein
MQSQSAQSRPSKSTVIFRNILLATDFSDASLTALQYAIGAGRPYDSRVLIVHIIPAETPASVPPEAMPVDPESSRRHAEKEMSAFLRAAPLGSVRYKVLIQSGEILAAITGLVTEHSIDLIVAGTHGRGGTKKLLLGSVAEQIFRGVACPVLTIGPHVEQDRPTKGEAKKILYATDFKAGSLEAWPYAISIAEAHRAHLTLVHILGEDTPLFAREGTEASFKERLKQLLPVGKGLSLSVDFVVRVGSAAEGILQAAKDEDANLIVMGVRQNPSWSAAHLPWAIAHQVVCHSHCPVLTVRG